MKHGEHSTQVIIKNQDKYELAVLMFDEDSKDKAMKVVRERIHEVKADHYFLIFESWMSHATKGDEPYIRPMYHKNRTEALIIAYFNKDLTHKVIINPFKRKGKKIIWGERSETGKDDNAFSMWNFYLEEEGLEEHARLTSEQTTELYLSEIAERMSKKYHKEVAKAKTNEDMEKIAEKVVAELEQERARINDLIRDGE